MRQADKDAIARLSAREVADRLGLLDGTTEGGRYRFAGYGGSHWIHFHSDGRWTGHKPGYGGDAVSLVQAYMTGPPDFHPETHDHYYGEAVDQIAEAFSLWRTMEPVRRRAEELARGQEAEDAGSYLRELLAHPRSEDTAALLDALVVGEITLAADYAGTGALCWQPAVPWQGVKLSRKDGGELGGWTKARAEEWAAHGLELLVMDFDGAKDLRPRVDLIDRIKHELGKRGVHVAAHVWSSFGADEDRAKAHLYFRGARRAASIEEWMAWWDLVETEIAEIVRGFPTEEGRALGVDRATRQIQRLVRLPGYAPFGKTQAAVLEQATGEVTDFAEILETLPTVWSYPKGGGLVTVELGERCTRTFFPEEGDPQIDQLGSGLWPLACYSTPEGDEHGICLRVETYHGGVRYTTVDMGKLTDKSRRVSAAAALRTEGAQILSHAANALLVELDAAVMYGHVPRRVELQRHCGWVGERYILGSETLAELGDVFVERSSASVERRLHRAGTLEGWCTEVAAQCTTYPLQLAVGVSLAGAMLRKLGQHPFIFHLAGPGSSGKSLGVEVAASIWSAPDTSGLALRWDATPGSLEALAELAMDACLGMDELHRFRDGDGAFANALHILGDSGGRARLEQHGGTWELGRHRRWYCTTVSSGEVAIADKLGGALQAGHAVRALDVQVTRDEMTESAAHTRALRAATMRHHGVASEHWVKALTSVSWDGVRERIGRLSEELGAAFHGDRGESARVLDIIALIVTALELAHDVGLTPWGAEARGELARWAADRIVGERIRERVHDPHHRMLAELLVYIDEDVSRAPFVDPTGELSAHPRGLVGLRDDDYLHVTESWIKRSRLHVQCGVVVRTWLQWLDDQGAITRHGQYRKAGYKKRFWQIDLERAEAILGVPPVPVVSRSDLAKRDGKNVGVSMT